MGIFNVDWFSFTADFENYDINCNDTLRLLFEHLDKEREKLDAGFIDLALFSFEVLNHGSRSYYYILHNDDMQIKFARVRSKNKDTYPVYVHFKSHMLWSDLYGQVTLLQKFNFVIEWLQDIIGGKYMCSKINRLDLCFHTDTIPDDFTADNFVGKHTVDRTYRTHRVISGIEIGSRKTQKLFMRAYNKYLEVRASKKEWFYEIWLKSGLNIRKVWNIEFQLNRDFFTETKINKKTLDTAEDCMSALGSIWNYLTTVWLTYRIPDNDRRTRWSIHPFWLDLQIFLECKKLSRDKQIELPTVEALAPGLCGYLSSLAARKGGTIEEGTIFKELYAVVQEYQIKYGKDFEEIVEKKKKLLGQET